MNQQYKIIIILFAIFILAFGIRGNLLQYDSFFEYDMYWEARMTSDLVTQGALNNPDTLAYYQVGGAPQTITNPLFILNASIYQGLFGWNIGYNYDVFTKLMQLLPAIFGALICVVVYFIGKAASNGRNVVGIIAGLVAAITPAFVYRTLSGAQITNSFGFLPFSLGILFLFWAFKEEKMTKKWFIFSILSGLSFMCLVFTWSMYLIVPLILIMFWAYYSISRLIVDKNKQKDSANILSFAIIYALFNIGCWISGYDWQNVAASFMGVPTIIIQVIGIGVPIIGVLIIWLRPNFNEDNRKMIYSIIALAFIAVCIGTVYFTTLGIDSVDRSSTGSMVGEESLGSQFFTQKYNIYNLFIPVAFVCAIGLFIWKKTKYDFMPLLLGTFILLFVMAWMKLKFTFVLGYGMIFASIIIAIMFYELWQLMKDKNQLEMKLLFVPSLFILLMGIAAGGIFILDYVPNLDTDPALQGVINYFNTQTPEDTHILNSWGQGHILTYTTGRAVSADNRNYSSLANKQFAEFENNQDTEYVYNMISEMGVNYVLVSLNDFRSMQSNEFYIHNRVDGSLGREFTLPIINSIPCARDGNILNCSNAGQVDITRASIWTDTPFDFYQGQYPLYLYAVGNYAVILNKAANNTNLAKVLSNHPDTAGKYEKVFQSGTYIILRVIAKV